MTALTGRRFIRHTKARQTGPWPDFSELNKAYPQAKFILTDRSPVTSAQSFGSTIYKLLEEADQAPEKDATLA